MCNCDRGILTVALTADYDDDKETDSKKLMTIYLCMWSEMVEEQL